MQLEAMHPEDVKAEIRKRFKTVKAFEEGHDLWAGAVHDLFRGNRSQRVIDAIKRAIGTPISDPQLSRDSDCSRANPITHRKKPEAN